MNNKKIRRLITSALIIAGIVTFYPMEAKAEWKRDSKGWWFTEGNSWATGWRNIGGNWYNFDSTGYMNESRIIDGYFIDENGVWIKDMPKEVQAYVNNNIKNPIIIDIDNDGTYEAITNNDYTSMVSMSVSFYKYDNGTVNSQKISTPHAGYAGYNKEEGKVLIFGSHNGAVFGKTYKFNSSTCKLVEVDDIEGSLGRESFTLNGENLSKEQMKNFLNKYFDYLNCSYSIEVLD